MRPYFIGLGARNSGTSWIYENLRTHPQICIPIKEIHFFSKATNFFLGIKWYEGHFMRCELNQKCGEFCTSYLSSWKAPLRISHFYSKTKLLAVLRNPLDRAFSNYKNDLIVGNVKKGSDFFSVLNDHPEYINQGRYAEQLEHYLRYFPRENMLILIYEDIQKDPQIFMSKIYQFLDVDSEFISPLLHDRINPTHVPKSHAIEKINRLSSSIQSVIGGSLSHILKKPGLKRIIWRSNREKKQGIPELTLKELEWLHEKFASSIRRLEDLLERELQEWKIKIQTC